MTLKPRTLSSKLLLIIAAGAVLPLAIVGLWLTRSAERAGIELLRTQLDHASDAIIADADRRWTLRSGELQLLANNNVARSLLAGEVVNGTDSAYLARLARSFSASVPSISYIDSAGRERWAFAVSQAGPGFPERAGAVEIPTLPIEVPIALDGRVLGKLVARVGVHSILALQAARVLVPSATLSAFDAKGRRLLEATEPTDASSAERVGGVNVSRTGQTAPLRIVVSAPSADYARPFEESAKTGVGVLMLVTLVALAMSVGLTNRVTRSLTQLADAAAGVAAGNLDKTVTVVSDDEIGHLGNAFNAMTDSLRQTLAELSRQRAFAAVGEFAASLSHEVRNSLTAVRVDLQHARVHLPDDNQGTRLVGRALESVRRLDATVTGALRVARNGTVAMMPLDLNAVLRVAIRSAEPSFAEHSASLEPMAESPPVTIDGDAAALEQLFVNLLMNAAQASASGSSTRVELDSRDDCVTIRVIDSGCGIDDSLLARIGSPFLSTKARGTGLGLPIAKRIAAAHGGELTFETTSQRGTVAAVRLPVRRAQ
jgi:signal transduction histidine kinase